MNHSKTIPFAFKGDKEQKERMKKIIEMLDFETPCEVLYISCYLGLSAFERIFEKCNFNKELFRRIIFNPSGWNIITAPYYLPYYDLILEKLPNEVKKRYFVFLEKQKNTEVKGGENGD